MSIETMKQALEALESCTPEDTSTGHVVWPSYDEDAVEKAITSLRQAIAEAESKRAALDAIIKSSEKRNEEWDALSADEQSAYHAQNACPYCGGSGHKDDIAEAEKQEQGEPVAWMKEGWGPDCGPYIEFYRDDEMGWRDREEWTPLYTTPQQRTWVGLTYEEIDSMVEVTDLSGAYYYDDLYAVVRAAEAKLTEKNT
jgi:hypothetical protein